MDLAGDLLRRFESVSWVGEKMRFVLGHQQDAVRSGVARQVPDIGRSGNQQRVDFKLRQACGKDAAALVNFSQANSLAVRLQDGHRIDTRGAAGGEQCRGYSDCGERGRCQDVGRRIRRLNVVEQAPEGTARGERCG